MTEKQFYDWQTVGGTDDVMRFAQAKGTNLIWSIARDGEGFLFRVATLDETLREKIRFCNDPSLRQSNRFKCLADIAELVESNPQNWDQLPEELQSKLDEAK
jgi:hypothetical protein